jgi:hypothetical protein
LTNCNIDTNFDLLFCLESIMVWAKPVGINEKIRGAGHRRTQTTSVTVEHGRVCVVAAQPDLEKAAPSHHTGLSFFKRETSCWPWSELCFIWNIN